MPFLESAILVEKVPCGYLRTLRRIHHRGYFLQDHNQLRLLSVCRCQQAWPGRALIVALSIEVPFCFVSIGIVFFDAIIWCCVDFWGYLECHLRPLPEFISGDEKGDWVFTNTFKFRTPRTVLFQESSKPSFS